MAKQIDWDTVEIDGASMDDYPDFCDAYMSAASWEDGTPLTDDELDKATDEYADEVHIRAGESFY